MYTSEIICNQLKRVAKKHQKNSDQFPNRASALDFIAKCLGFNNWSLLHKHVARLSDTELTTFQMHLYSVDSFVEYLPRRPAPTGINEMVVWVRNNYDELCNNAYFESPAELPTVDLHAVLNAEFSKHHPPELIEDTAQKMMAEYEELLNNAVAEMNKWISLHFTPLVEFAYFDRESENGYAWPSVELDEELAEEFSERFPEGLIQYVANEREIDEGPFGRGF